MEAPPVPAPAPTNNVQNQDANANPDQNQPAQQQQQLVPNQPILNQPAFMQPVLAALQKIHQQVLNWSHFKPEFAGRPDKDADWMMTHNFPNDVKVQRFCLTVVEEVRLWYESLTPIANDWPALQENFRRQYSKIGNTRDQSFHAWRSFHYDENSETVDAYVNRISK